MGGGGAEFAQEIHVDIFLFVVSGFHDVFIVYLSGFKVRNITVIIRQFKESLYFQDASDGIQIDFFRVVGGLADQCDGILNDIGIIGYPDAFHIGNVLFGFSAVLLHTPAANPVVDECTRVDKVADGVLHILRMSQLYGRNQQMRGYAGCLGWILVQFSQVYTAAQADEADK